MYYFAGNPTDNWIQFAGFYWRIIRINGDGTIRIIYQGTSANATGTSTQIDKIATEIEDTIKTYSDSPAEILRELREQINDLYNELKNDENDDETIKDKLNNIYSNMDSALNEYSSYSLYSKIEDLNSELSDLNSKLSNSLDPYAYDSLYSKIQDLESKLDSINLSDL